MLYYLVRADYNFDNSSVFVPGENQPPDAVCPMGAGAHKTAFTFFTVRQSHQRHERGAGRRPGGEAGICPAGLKAAGERSLRSHREQRGSRGGRQQLWLSGPFGRRRDHNPLCRKDERRGDFTNRLAGRQHCLRAVVRGGKSPFLPASAQDAQGLSCRGLQTENLCGGGHCFALPLRSLPPGGLPDAESGGRGRERSPCARPRAVPLPPW
ncbi:hypothetical protein SDC9_68936 [bioreactor metagenome]|uniref:Uncharacterized protein n=1 Tax=bioreactor metagenome TaxID=1076179 RepID=A0A644Y3I5_9ZZZZ